ncbi:hypothetical protein VPH35_065868 [Triticum aestivum]
MVLRDDTSSPTLTTIPQCVSFVLVDNRIRRPAKTKCTLYGVQVSAYRQHAPCLSRPPNTASSLDEASTTPLHDVVFLQHCNALPLSWRTTEYGVQPRRGATFIAYRSCRHMGGMILVLADHRIWRLAKTGHQPRPSLMSPFFGPAV